MTPGVRLAYAQHVYKAQGLTSDRSLVLMGGWQTDRERAYVALSRARERTDVYVSREDLGEDGTEGDLVGRLGHRVAVSHAQQASVTRDRVAPRDPPLARDGAMRGAVETEPEGALGAGVEAPVVESRVGRVLREQRQRERARGRDHGIE